MHTSLAAYRYQLLQSKCYVPSPSFVQNTRWQYDDTGHVLVDISTNTNMVAVVIARVLEHNLYCGPNGNYDKGSKFGSLAVAKYHLQLGRPTGTVFAIDYDKLLENAAKLQSQIASTQDRRNFIIADGVIRNLRFTRRVFEERVRIPFTPPFFLCLIFFF